MTGTDVSHHCGRLAAFAAATLIATHAASAQLPMKPGDGNEPGSVTLLDFEDDAQFDYLQASKLTTVEPTSEASMEGKRAAKIIYSAVPEGVREYPAVVVQGDGLTIRDFTPYEAISLWVMNPGDRDAELSLSVWDIEGHRSFPIPSTFTIKPGKPQHVFARLALHGLDAKNIGSVHFYQKINRVPYTLVIDDVQLLSPQAGRTAAKIQLVRTNLSIARLFAKALGAEEQIEPRIADLFRRLGKLEESSRTANLGSEKTQRLLELARIASASQELTSAANIAGSGRRLTLAGPQPQANWLSNQELIRGLQTVRLFDTTIGDEVFSRLEPAQDLTNFIASGKNLTGAGVEQLTSDKLSVLNLSATSANDHALRHLGKFSSLENLRLNDTDVTSEVLKHLSGLKRLKTLELNDSGVSDVGFAEVSKLTRLEHLRLARTKVTGNSLEHLKGLGKLKTLDLRDTKIDDAGLTHLGGLHRLETLQLAGTRITGASFSELQALDNLFLLNLNGTRVGDAALRQLGGLPKLNRLELSSAPITDGSLQHVTQSARLNYLDVYGTNITDAGMAHLKDQRGLQQLYVGGTQISDKGIASIEKLTKLTHLDLSGTQVTDACLTHLAGMKNLVSLRLGNTRITGVGLAHLVGLSKLQLLDLTGTSVTDDAMASIARLADLRTMYLGGTRVTDTGMTQLPGAVKLVELKLDATVVGDNGLKSLSALPNLARLGLDETAITDEGLKHLQGMKKLRRLSLNHTKISDTGLSHLGDHYSALELAHTRITDQGVEHLQRNDQLTDLSLAATGVTNNALKLLQATPGLEQLNLSETNITDAGLRHLIVLPELAALDLSGTGISDVGIDSLVKLSSLQRLSLENSRVTSHGASYLEHRSPTLELQLVFPWAWGERWSYFSLPNNRATPEPVRDRDALLQQLRELTSLGYLHIDQSLMTPDALRSLKDLPTLEHLSFQGTQLTDELLTHLLGLSQVARLDLAGTSITDAGLIHLKDMQSLRELNLQETEISGHGLTHLANLSRLQSLNLRQTSLSDDGLVHIARLEQLRKLELSSTEVTDAGIEQLLKLANLQYLDLYGTNLTDAALAQLKHLPSLRYCYLSNTNITDAGIEHLGGLTDIVELGLDGTKLSDQGLAVVRSHTNLRRLRIGRTRVTQAGLAHLDYLPNLIQLELNELPVTDNGVRALRRLSKLESLDLSGTQVTDLALVALSEFPVLTEVNLQDTTVTESAAELFRSDNPAIDITTGITRTGYSLWSVLITTLYGLVVIAICFYGSHRYWLAWLFVRDTQVRTSPQPKMRFDQLPAVTVQLPMFNERQVAERIIEAACAIDYPPERLQIQVLDDSTDESADVARECCERMAAAGHNIEFLHRSSRDGFKGGALAAGLETATGEFIAVFDADFVPASDILQQTIHQFTDSEIGMVQTEWFHLNRSQSLLTECQAMFLDGHFVVEQTVRSRNNRWFNFNGTAGVLRKSCIEDAGGWDHDTLTEDTDLSYRAQLAGWKFVYLPTVRCGAELPSSMTAFLGQQHRWTKGLIQNSKKLLPRILRSSAPWRVKLEAWYHLTSPVMYLVMFLLSAIALPALFIETPLAHWQVVSLTLGLGTLWLGTFAAAIFYLLSQRALGIGLGRTLVKLPLLFGLGIGMSVVNARAVLEALLGFRSPFVRTPKFGGRTDCDTDPSVARQRLRIPTGLLELVLGGVLFACLVLSLLRPYTLIGAPFLLLFAAGYAGVGWAGLMDRFGTRSTTSVEDPKRDKIAGPTTDPVVAKGWLPSPQGMAVGTLAILLMAATSGSMLMMVLSRSAWATSRADPVSLGLDLTTADWRIATSGAETSSAIKRVYAERGSLVLNVQIDETNDQGAIILDLNGVMQHLGNSVNSRKEILFELAYPARFTGEFQAFAHDLKHRSQYGSFEIVESFDVRSSATVSLVPNLRVPPMGYQDSGFDPAGGIRQIGLKISAQSDRVRGTGYRPFRGTITVTGVRIRDVDSAAHPEPEIRLPAEKELRPLQKATARQFVATSGVDRPWPIGYGFSGPLTDAHIDDLDRGYEAIASLGCTFTRVYIGDYRTGLLFDGKGTITGVDPTFLRYVDRLAEVANQHGITVMFSLTDNTMADGRGLESVELLKSSDASELFINNALAPLIEKLKGRQVIWDVFNEPENVTAIPLRDIQRYVDRVLAVGRRADPEARFTVVSRSRPDIVYWQGRGLDLYSHNIFTDKSIEESIAEVLLLDAPIMVAEMAPQLATSANLEALRAAGYSGVGIWGWDTDDKYAWGLGDLGRIAAPLVRMSETKE